MTADSITISGLRVLTKVGATEEERRVPQTVLIDLVIEGDLAAAAKSDDLDDTVDYARVAETVGEFVRSSEMKLLEALAGAVAERVCAFPRVERVSVAITKEAPPIAEEVGPITVRITRP